MKNTHIKTYIIVAIFLSIVGISIAYATLSQQLQIKTTTTVQSSQTSWNIAITDHYCYSNTYAKAPTIVINGTTITISDGILKAPGDMFTCVFKVINKGELNAKISSVDYKAPTFSGTGTTAVEDSKLVSTNLWRVFIWRDTKEDVKIGDLLSAKEGKEIEIAFGIQKWMTSFPTNPVTFSNATYTINFEQA